MQRAQTEGLEKVSSNGCKQKETMLTFWPAFEIKYSFVVYFAVAGVVSWLYPSFLSTYWKDFLSDFFFFFWNRMIIWKRLWFTQPMSHHRVPWMPSCLQFSIMETHNQTESTIYRIHKRILENIRICTQTHINTIHILIHMLNMYCVQGMVCAHSHKFALSNCVSWLNFSIGRLKLDIFFFVMKFGFNFYH